MPSGFVQRVTFAGGEAGERLHARADLARYQISVEFMENYVVMLEGGATRTPGTRMVLELKDQSQRGRLLPFRVSSTDYYMLVINGGKSRFVRQGGFIQNPDTTPYEITVPWIEAELDLLRSATTGNQMFVAVGSKAPQELVRNDHTDWDCDPMQIDNGPVGDMNIAAAVTLQASGVTGAIALTGVGSPLTSDWIGAVLRLDEPSLQYVPEWIAGETGLTAGTSQRRWNGNVYLAASGTDAGVNAPIHTEGSVASGQGKVTWDYLHSGFGYVRVTAVTNANSGNATVLTRLPDSVVAHPTSRWFPPAWTPLQGFPDNIAFNSPMLTFYRGDEAWFSSKLDPRDFAEGADEESAFRFRLRAPDGSLVEVRWVAACGGWVIGTSDIEWVLRKTGTAGGGLSILNVDPVPEDNKGSIRQVPAVIDGGVMFIGQGAKRLHFATIDPNKSGSPRLDVDELSVMVAHIFKPGAVKIVWQRDPRRVAWILRADGTLATLTYMPRQEVLAFARQPRINGFVEDIERIPSVEGGVDELYMIVRRTINGVTKRYVEQLQNYFEPSVFDADGNALATGAWFLDCAQHYSGAPVTAITSLVHLEGQVVGVFADGAMQKRKVVAGGTITLDRAASDVLVGLPIVARIVDLPRDLTLANAPSANVGKSIHEAVIDLLDAAGGELFVTPDDAQAGEEDLREPIMTTGGKKKHAPLKLFTGRLNLPVEGETALNAAAGIINDDALPCTVLGLSPLLTIEEDA